MADTLVHTLRKELGPSQTIGLGIRGGLGWLVEVIRESELGRDAGECPSGRAGSGSDDARASATGLIFWGLLLCSEAKK